MMVLPVPGKMNSKCQVICEKGMMRFKIKDN